MLLIKETVVRTAFPQNSMETSIEKGSSSFYNVPMLIFSNTISLKDVSTRDLMNYVIKSKQFREINRSILSNQVTFKANN